MKESGDDEAGEPDEEEAAPTLMPQENKKKGDCWAIDADTDKLSFV